MLSCVGLMRLLARGDLMMKPENICFEGNICLREAKMFMTSGKKINFCFKQQNLFLEHIFPARLWLNWETFASANNVSATIFPSQFSQALRSYIPAISCNLQLSKRQKNSPRPSSGCGYLFLPSYNSLFHSCPQFYSY